MAHPNSTTVIYSADTCERTTLDILNDAIDRKLILDIEYPLLYNKMVRHYEDRGIDFYGNVDEDYDILLDNLESDLYYECNF
tara:strand:+ start:123 stop:368 length:246 start_codon:yes stop_codon:yes gene_type:complete